MEAGGCAARRSRFFRFRSTIPGFAIPGRFLSRRRGGGTREVAGTDWRFNGWGGKYQPHADDDRIPERLLAAWNYPRLAVPLVLEGGAIISDGEGTLYTTEECLLNENRNPHIDRAGVEAALGDHLGARRTVWMPWGLEDDETDGHIDNAAALAAPARVLLNWTQRPRRFERRAPWRQTAPRLRTPATPKAAPSRWSRYRNHPRRWPGKRPSPRALLPQFLHLQRRRDRAVVRRPARRRSEAHPRRGVSGARDRAGAGARYCARRRRHPLHHAAGAGGRSREVGGLGMKSGPSSRMRRTTLSPLPLREGGWGEGSRRELRLRNSLHDPPPSPVRGERNATWRERTHEDHRCGGADGDGRRSGRKPRAGAGSRARSPHHPARRSFSSPSSSRRHIFAKIRRRSISSSRGPRRIPPRSRR